jgi:hypothetical protein
MGFLSIESRAAGFGVFVMAGCLLSAGCHSATPADMVGEYSILMNGQTVKVAKVTQAGTGYDMEWFADEKWIPVTGPVTALSKQQLGKLLTGPVDGIVGLQSKEQTILMVPKGWTQVFLGHNGAKNTEFKSATGYVWFSPLGLMDLNKL